MNKAQRVLFERRFPVPEFIEFLDGKYRAKTSLKYDPATRILAELKQAQWEGWQEGGKMSEQITGEIDSPAMIRAEAVMQYILAAPLSKEILERKYCEIISRYHAGVRQKEYDK